MPDLRTRVSKAVEELVVGRARVSGVDDDTLHDAAIEILRALAGSMARARGLPAPVAASVGGTGEVAEVGVFDEFGERPLEALGTVREALLGLEVRRAPADDRVLFFGHERPVAFSARRREEFEPAERAAVEALPVTREVAPGTVYLHPTTAPQKAQGAFYTADPLARPTAEATLDPLLDAGVPTTIDPAMGGGAFLLAAHRAMVRRGVGPAAAQASIFGLDIDPVAVEAARLALWLETADATIDYEGLAHRLRVADGLFDDRVATGTFDAVVGNPPWEIVKPNSREWFARHDPFFRRLGKVSARARRARLFVLDPALEAAWDAYEGEILALSRRVSESDEFRFQGRGDCNTWKLFLERALALLRPGGRLGMIVPAGLATDLGAAELRRFLLEENRWEWLFTFENRRGLFDIHRSWRFGPVVVQRGGETKELRAAFMRTDPEDWARRDELAVRVPRADVDRFSPDANVLLELHSDAERRVLEKVFARSVFVMDVAGLTYRREFDLTNHVDRFVECGDLERDGLTRDAAGRFVDDRGVVHALPLLQGVMVRDFAFPAAAWRGGRGSRADWVEPDADGARSRWAVRVEDVEARAPAALGPRLALRDVQNATNVRTFLATLVPGFPCGNTLPVLSTGDPIEDLWWVSVLTSFVVDRVLRLRMTQNHLNLFTLRELPVPADVPPDRVNEILTCAARLALNGSVFDGVRRDVATRLGVPVDTLRPVTARNARTELRAEIDAGVARAFGLDVEDLRVILADCDLPAAALRKASITSALDAKGFWRVDRDLEPEDRHPIRTLARMAAFRR